MVSRWHNKLGKRFSWYDHWHRHPLHPHIHWGALGLMAAVAGKFLVAVLAVGIVATPSLADTLTWNSQSDWSGGVATNVDLATSPGSVQLSAHGSGALLFDRAGQYAKLPADSSDYSQGLTVEMWVNPASSTAAGGYERILDYGSGQAVNNIIVYRQTNTNNLLYTVCTPNGNDCGTAVTATNFFTANTWVHIAVTEDASGNVTIYKNGTAAKTGTSHVPTVTTRTSNYVAHSNWSSESSIFFRGLVDEIRLSNTVRYTGTFTPPTEHVADGSTTRLYHFNEGSGQTLSDASSAAAHGTLGADSSVGPDDGIWERRETSRRLYFDGTDDYAQASSLSGLAPATGTLETWVKADPTQSSAARLVELGEATNQVSLRVNDSGQAVLVATKAGSAVATLTSAATVHDNGWHHVAATWSAQGSYLFVDGVLSAFAEGDKTLTLPASAGVRLGSSLAGDQFFKGYLKQVRLSSVVRYTAVFTPSSSPALDGSTNALWRVQEGSGGTLSDLSVQGNALSLGSDLGSDSNDPTWSNLTHYQTFGTLRLQYDGGATRSYSALSWSGTVPEGTSLQARARTAATQGGLSAATWSAYSSTSPYTLGLTDRFIEVEFLFTGNGAATATPVLDQASIDHVSVTGSVPATPTNSSPVNNYRDTTAEVTLSASAFSDPDNDTHAASQWQVSSVSGNYNSPAADSGEDATNLTSYTTATLSEGTYYWRVRYQDSAGNWSAYSSETSFAVDLTAPSAPTGISATPGNGQVSLAWTNPAQTDFTGLNIYRSTTAGLVGTLVHTTGSSDTAWVDATVTNGTLYYYSFESLDTAGNVRPPTTVGGPYVTDANTKLLWHLNDGSGSPTDSSGNGATASAYDVTWTTGLYGGGLQTNGGYFYTSNYASRNNWWGAGTLELWMKPTSDIRSGSHGILSSDDWCSGPYVRAVSGNITYGSGCNGEGAYAIPANWANTWVHVAMIWDGSATKLYINNTEASSFNSSSGDTYYMGGTFHAGYDSNGGYYSSMIFDEVRVSNSARTNLVGVTQTSALPTDAVVSLTAPNGGETWNGTTTHNITWTATGTGISTVTLEYSTDNGATWTTIATGEANDGTYEWGPPEVARVTTALVRIKALSAGGSVLGTGVSAAVFTLDTDAPSPPAPVTAQNTGGQITLSWGVVSDNDVASIKIYRSTAAGSLGSLKETLSDPSVTSWADTDTLVAGTTYYYSVIATDWAGNTSASLGLLGKYYKNVTGGIFAGTRTDAQINFSPWSSENMAESMSGQLANFYVTWEGLVRVDVSDPVTFALTADNRATLTVDGAQIVNLSATGTATGTATLSRGLHYLRLTHRADAEPNEVSLSWSTATGSLSSAVIPTANLSGQLPVTPATTALTVTSPVGGENWQGGSSHNITWSETGSPAPDSVWIYLSRDDGASYSERIAADESGTGSYSWTVPAIDVAQAKIRLEARKSTGEVLATSESALPFTIDTAGPTAPTSFTATPAANGSAEIVLRWTNPTETDLAKINIYRSTSAGTLGSLLTQVNAPGTSHTDTTVSFGTTYYYTLRAEDTLGNEGLPLDDANTVGLWLMNEGSGTSTTADSSGNNYSGSLYNSPSWTTGRNGTTALRFNYDMGWQQWVDIGSLGAAPNAGTIEFWMKSDQLANYPNAFTTDNYGSDAAIRFEETSAGVFRVIVGNESAQSATYNLITSLQTGTWYHVAVTWDQTANRLKGYVNNALVFNQSHSYWPSSFNDVAIGNGYWDRYWYGTLDSVRISNSERTNFATYWGPESTEQRSAVVNNVTVDVTSPDGGERWAGGSSHNITWTASGSQVSTLALYYSSNGGTSYSSIITGLLYDGPNGSYSWSVPSITSSSVLVKTEVRDEQGNVLGWNTSAAVFEIDSTAPDYVSGVTATASSGQVILSWNNPATSDFDGLNIYRSTTSGDIGSIVHTTAASDTTWTDTGLTNGTVYYYAFEPFDTLNNTLPPVSVGGPYAADSNTKLLWHLDEASGAAVDSSTSGWNYNEQGTVSITAGKYGNGRSISNDNSFFYTNNLTGGWWSAGTFEFWYKSDADLRSSWYGIASMYDYCSGLNIHTGNGYLSIGNSCYGFADYSIPANWANTWKHIAVTWNSTDTKLYVDGSLAGTYNLGNNNTFYQANSLWVGYEVGSGYSAGGVYDEVRLSDVERTNFSVPTQTSALPTDAVVSLTAPNGGETWNGTTTHNITWTATGTGISTVTLEYSTDNGATWTTIATGEANDGTYTWDTPAVSRSTTALVRVTALHSTGQTMGSDISDAVFALDGTPPPAVTGLTKNLIGSEAVLSWVHAGASDLDHFAIYRSTTWGSLGSLLSDSVGASQRSYTDTSLVANTVYYYTVYAVDLAGNVSPNGSTVDANTVAAWRFNDEAGHIVTDSSGNGHHGYFGSSSEIDAADPSWTLSGHQRAGATFGGAHYVSVDDDPAFTLSGDFTVESWVKFTTVGTTTLVGHDTGSGNQTKWNLMYESGNLKFHVNTGSATLNVTGAWTPATGTWYHVAVTRSGTKYRLYVNGVQVGSATSSIAIPDPAVALTFGSAEGGQFFRGVLDSVTISNVARGVGALNYDDQLAVVVGDTSVTVTAPNGSEAWPASSARTISWSTAGTAADSYSVYYSTNGGASYSTALASGVTGTSYSWTTPNSSTTAGRIKVVAYSAQGDVLASDISDGNFTIDAIAPGAITGVTVTPSTSGPAQVVANWTNPSDLDLAATNIYRSTTSGQLGSLLTTVNVPGTTYTDTDVSYGTTYYYTFKGVDAVGNESTSFLGNGLTGSYYADNSFSSLVGTQIDPEVNFNWGTSAPTTPAGAPSDNFSVRWEGYFKADATSTLTFYIQSDDGSALYLDDMDTPILTASCCSETSTSTSVTAGIHQIKYEMSENSGAAMAYVRYSGSGITYQIIPQEKLSTVYNTIVQYSALPTDATVSITTPNGGEVYKGGTAHDVTWTASGSGVSSVALFYSTNGGTSYSSLASGQAASGAYSWTMPSITSSTVKVKAEARNAQGDVMVFDASDANFTITLTAPSAPTNVTATPSTNGSPQVALSWTNPTSTGFGGMNIYRSTTSGTAGSLIHTTDAGDTSYVDTSVGVGTYYYTFEPFDTAGNTTAAESVGGPYSTNASTSLLWHLDQSSAPFTDSSGNSRSGSWSNATSVTGQYSKGVHVNNGYIYTSGYAEAWQTAGSVEFWYKPDNDPRNGTYGLFSSGDSWFGLNIWTDGSGNLNIGSSGGAYTPASYAIPADWTNTWKHIAVTWDSSKTRLYIDNSLVGTYDIPNQNADQYYYSTMSTVSLGYDGWGNYGYGSFDELRISSVARTSFISLQTQYEAVTSDAVPGAVTGLQAVAGSGEVQLSWTAPDEPDIAGYNIYRSTAAGTVGSKLNSSGLVTATNYTDVAASNGTTYYYTVRAVDDGDQESTGSSRTWNSATGWGGWTAAYTNTAGSSLTLASVVGGQSLASSATASMSNGPDYGSIASIKDGNTTTWVSSNSNDINNPYVLTWGAAQVITKVRFFYGGTAYNGPATNLTIRYWNGSSWVTPTEWSNKPTGWTDPYAEGSWSPYYTLSTPVSTTKLAVYTNSGAFGSTNFDLAEWEVRGGIAYTASGTATITYTPEAGVVQHWSAATLGKTTPTNTTATAEYSADGSSWTSDITAVPSGDTLYARLTLATTDAAATASVDSLNVVGFAQVEATPTTGNLPPEAPTASSPTDGYRAATLPSALVVSGYIDPESDAHAATQWLVDDAADFATPVISTGDDAVNLLSYSLGSSGLSAGTYYWKARFKDAEGNYSDYSTARSFTYDTTAPAQPTSVTAAPGSAVVNLSWTNPGDSDFDHLNIYRSTVSGFTPGAENKLGESSSSAATTYSDATAINGTTYYYQLTSVDTSGNESSATSEVSATPLANTTIVTAPTSSSRWRGGSSQIISWSTTGYGIASMALLYSTNGGSSYSSIATGESNDGSYSWSVPLANSTNALVKVEARDSNGNVLSTDSSDAFVLDSTAPVLGPVSASSSNGQSVAKVDDVVTVTFTTSESLTSTPTVSFGGQAMTYSSLVGSTYTYTRALTGAETEGTAAISVSATDLAGNPGTTSGSFATDFTAPTVPTITAPSAPVTVHAVSYDIAGTAEANSLVRVYRDSEVVASQQLSGGGTSFLISTALNSNSVNEFSVTSTDLAGNASVAAEVPAITEDADAPAAPTVTTPAEPVWTSQSTYQVTGTAEANSLVRVYRNSEVVASQQLAGDSTAFDIEVTLSTNTANVLTVTSVDDAANESSPTDVPTITHDSLAPYAPTGVSAQGGDAQVALSWSNSTDSDLAYIRVYRSTVSGFTPDPLNQVERLAAPAVNWTDTSVINGTTYHYRLKSEDGAGNLSSSSAEVGMTPSDITVTVSAPAAGASWAGGSVKEIVWSTSSADGIDSISLYHTAANGGGGFTSIATGETDDGSYNWTVGEFDLASAQVKVEALDSLGNVLAYGMSGAFTIDSTAPVLSNLNLTSSNDQSVAKVGNTITLTFTTSETLADTPTVTFGGQAMSYSSLVGSTYTFTRLLDGTETEGSATVSVAGSDAAGNEGAASSSFATDFTAPVDPVVVAPASAVTVNAASYIISGTAEANSLVRVYLDGSAVASQQLAGGGTEYAISVTLTADTAHSFSVRSFDAAGNESGSANVPTITEDSTAPATPTITDPTSPVRTSSSTYVVSGAVEADSLVKIYRDSAEIASQQLSSGATDFNLEVSLLNNQDNNLQVSSTDAAGNESASGDVATITHDTVAPAGPTGLTVTGGDAQVEVGWTNAADADLASVRVYRSTVSGFTADASNEVAQVSAPLTSWTDTDVTNGTAYYYRLKSEDGAGNLSTATAAAGATPSNVVVTVTSPTSGDHWAGGSNHQITWSTSADDGVSSISLYYSTNGGSSYSAVATGESNDGGYSWSVPMVSTAAARVKVEAVDDLGNVLSAGVSASFSIDSLAPDFTNLQLVINADRSVARAGDQVTLTFTVSEGLSGNPAVTLGGQSMVYAGLSGSVYTYTRTLTGAETEGSAAVEVSGSDLAGNTGSASSSLATDFSAPNAPVITSPASPVTVNTANYTVTGSAEANSLVRVYREGSVVASQQLSGGATLFSIVVPLLADTANSFTLTSSDAAGNESVSANVPVINRDSTAPAAPTVTDPTAAVWTSSTAYVVTGTAEAGSLVRLYRGGSLVGSQQLSAGQTDFAITLTLALNAANNLTATATDGVNNESGAVTVATIAQDGLAPAAPSSVQAAGGNGSITLTWNNPTDSSLAYVRVYRAASSGFTVGSATQVARTAVTTAWTDTAVANGTRYYYRVVLEDRAGNISPASVEVNALPDSGTTVVTAPTATARWSGGSTRNISWASASSAVASITIHYSVNGGGAYELVASGENNDGSYSWSVPVVNTAAARVKLESRDVLGNILSAGESEVFTIDSTTPALTGISVTAGSGQSVGKAGDTVTLSFTASESLAVDPVVRFDGRVMTLTSRNGTDYRYAYLLSGGEVEGQARISLSATDLAGNPGVAETTFTTDFTAPVLFITAPVTTGIYSTYEEVVTIKGTASDARGVVAVTSSVAGPVTGLNAWSQALTLPVGSTTVVYRALDRAGNEGATSLEINRLTVAVAANLKASYVRSEGAVVVSFDRPAAGLVAEIYRTDREGVIPGTKIGETTTGTFTDKEIIAGKTYYYTVVMKLAGSLQASEAVTVKVTVEAAQAEPVSSGVVAVAVTAVKEAVQVTVQAVKETVQAVAQAVEENLPELQAPLAGLAGIAPVATLPVVAPSSVSLLVEVVGRLGVSLTNTLQALALLRRPRSFGVVRRGRRGEVLAGATVELMTPDTRRVIEVVQTDALGRYMFLVDKRQLYRLRVSMEGYAPYERLVRGSIIHNEVVLGLALENDEEALASRRRSKRLLRLITSMRWLFLLSGTVVWLMLLLKTGPAWGVYLLGIYYVVVWCMELYVSFLPRPYGLVTEQVDRSPLGRVVVHIFNRDNKRVATEITNERGQFKTLLKPGSYTFAFARGGYRAATVREVPITRSARSMKVDASLEVDRG